MKNNKRSMIHWLIIALTVLVITKASYELKWFDLLAGIFKLETKPEKVQRVSFKALSFIATVDCEAEFLVKMSEMGWHFIKHYGRGMIFVKDGYEILITRKDYFNKYTLFEVTTKEIFDVI